MLLCDILPLFCTPTSPSHAASLTYSSSGFVSPEKTTSASVIIFTFMSPKRKKAQRPFEFLGLIPCVLEIVNSGYLM